MAENIDFYYFPASPPSRTILLLIKALGLKVNLKIINILVGENCSPEFLKINPQHTVPTLVDNGFVLTESRAMAQYLVNQYGEEERYFPKDAKQAALVHEKLYFDACTLYERLTAYFKPVLFMGLTPDTQKLEKLEEGLQYFDGFLEKTVWAAGPSFTVADFFFLSTISTAEAVKVDISKYDNITSWYERAKKAMVNYEYEDVMQKGADMIAGFWKDKTQDSD